MGAFDGAWRRSRGWKGMWCRRVQLGRPTRESGHQVVAYSAVLRNGLTRVRVLRAVCALLEWEAWSSARGVDLCFSTALRRRIPFARSPAQTLGIAGTRKRHVTFSCFLMARWRRCFREWAFRVSMTGETAAPCERNAITIGDIYIYMAAIFAVVCVARMISRQSAAIRKT